MKLDFAYHRRSSVERAASGLAIALAPNLRRDRVSFDGVLKDPLRFREAMSALHDVVISDLRYRPRDKSAYEAYQAAENQRLAVIRAGAAKGKRDELKARDLSDMPPSLESEFNAARRKYWLARMKYSTYLMTFDRELWRLLMPCDPVITVAPG